MLSIELAFLEGSATFGAVALDANRAGHRLHLGVELQILTPAPGTTCPWKRTCYSLGNASELQIKDDIDDSATH